jgi:hypothetical protein
VGSALVCESLFCAGAQNTLATIRLPVPHETKNLFVVWQHADFRALHVCKTCLEARAPFSHKGHYRYERCAPVASKRGPEIFMKHVTLEKGSVEIDNEYFRFVCHLVLQKIFTKTNVRTAFIAVLPKKYT